MKNLLFSLFLIILALSLPTSAFAIGSFDASNVYVSSEIIQFNFTNASGSNNIVGYSTIFCLDTQETVAYTVDGGKYDTGYNTGDFVSYTNTGYNASSHTDCVARIYTNNGSNDYQSSQHFDIPSTPTPTPTPSPSVKIVASPESGSKTVGTSFNIDVKAEDINAEAFNATRATVSVSSNLSITGINNPTSNACNFQYTQTPTTSNPSFAGAIFGGSSTGCTIYTMTLTPTSTGAGTITFTNGSIKAYSNNSEIMTGVQDGSFTITDAPTPTPTQSLDFTIASVLPTYHTTYTLTGTKVESLTHIFVNSSDANSTYPTSTTWENNATVNLGNNNLAVYGSDDNNNQTATQTVTVSRHTLADINGDGNVDLLDASLFAVDWDKTSNLTYNLSDMNDDGVVDLVDLSILAKLEQ